MLLATARIGPTSNDDSCFAVMSRKETTLAGQSAKAFSSPGGQSVISATKRFAPFHGFCPK